MWEALESRRLLSAGFVTQGAAGPPENDDFAHAIELVGAQPTGNGTTIGATLESAESALVLGDGSVWYTWKAPANAFVGISFSNFVSQNVNVFEGDSIATLKAVTDKFSGYFGNEFRAVADRTYRIAVSAPADNAADFSMIVRSGLPRVTIKAIDKTGAETHRGERANTAAFLVKRTGPTDQPLHVFCFQYTYAPNTATAGKDFVKLPGSVKIAAGKSSAKIVVHPLDDRKVELTETVDMGLTSLHDDYVTLGSRALIQILDNERHTRTARARPDAVASEAQASVFSAARRIESELLDGVGTAVW